MSCIAAPIRDSSGGIVAALSLSDSAQNLCQTWQQDIAGQLALASEKISRKLFPDFEA
jgi:DNA-binding IclR family transcriptional regulator